MFVIDPLLVKGKHVPQEPSFWELPSFIEGSRVEVYIHSGLVGLFEVVSHGVAGVSIEFYVKGTINIMRWVYMRPALPHDIWDVETSGWPSQDLVFGDMNVRDFSWDMACNTCGP